MRYQKNSEIDNTEAPSLFIKYSKQIAFAMIVISIIIIAYLVIFKPKYKNEAVLYPKNTTTPGILELRNRLARKIKNPEIKKGHELFLQKRFIEAEKLFKSLLNIIHDEERKFIYYYLGEISYSRKQYKQAADLFDVAISKDKRFFEALIKRGMCSIKQNDYETALSFIKKARSIKPKSFFANFELGKIYFHLKKFKRALAYFNNCLDIANDIRAYLLKGVCLYKTGMKSESVKIFTVVANTETEIKYRRTALIMLTKYYYSINDYPKVAGYLKDWKKLEPENENVYFELGKIFYLLKKYRVSYNFFRESYERKPSRDINLLYLAMTEVALKKYTGALFHIRKFLKKGNKNFRAYRIAGDCYFGLTEFRRALKNYKLYFKHVSNDNIEHEVYFRVANIHDALGNYKQAINYLNKLLKIPNISEKDVFYNLAVVYDHKGDYENSLHYLFKTLKITNEKEKIRSYIGDIYLKMKRFRQAIDFYKRVLKMTPESQIAAYKLGNAYLNSGDFNAAKSYFQKIILNKEKTGQKKEVTSLAYMRMGDIEQVEQNLLKAISLYEKSVKNDVNNTGAMISLAKMYVYTLHYKKAEKTLKTLLNHVTMSKDRSDVYFLLGSLRNKQGYKDRAISYLKRAVKLNPLNEDARTLLSNLD